MDHNLLLTLQQAFPTMSKRHKLIAQYIIDHYDKAAFMTATKLAQSVGVSESTVVRFAYALQFQGYPELQSALQEMVRGSLTTVQRLEMTDVMQEGEVLYSVLKSDMNSIRRTMDSVDPQLFSQAVDAIYGAKTIYLFGMRSASPLAQFLSYYLNYLSDHVCLLMNGVQDLFDQLMRAGPQDVFIGISFPRYSNRTVDCMRFAKDKGAKTVAITDSVISPLTEYADYTLIARSDMISLVDTLAAPMSLIQALIVAMCMRKKDEASDYFSQLEQLWAHNRVYAGHDR